MDKVIIGTARNVMAEYSAGTGNPEHKFIIAHFFDDELVTVEGFRTKEGAMIALEEYHGADIEYLFINLDGDEE